MNARFSYRSWIIGSILGIVLMSGCGFLIFTNITYQLLVYPPHQLGLLRTVTVEEIILMSGIRLFKI